MQTLLACEYLLLFVVMPAVMAIRPLPGWPLPALWALTLYCIAILSRQPDFDARRLWRATGAAAHWRPILALFIPTACAMALLVHHFAPHLFLHFPRRRPALWAAVMVLYPLLSVVPQTIVYRAFLFQRYRLLFPHRGMLILASGVTFAWAHIVLRNPLAPLLTLPAGLLFAWRYARSGSVLASSLEHALYGCLIFTVGLGVYFYTGAIR